MQALFIQIIGIVGAVLGIVSYQSNKHRIIMILKTASEAVFALQFVLLGAYTGVALNILGSIRNITFAYLVKKNKSTKPWIVVFSLAVIAAGVLTWAGPISLLAITGKLATTLAHGMKNASKVRFLTLPSCICWGVYDALSKSYAGIATEIFSVCSIIIAEIRIRLNVKKQKSENTEKPSYCLKEQ